MSDITYLYGFTGAHLPAPPRSLNGVHGAAITLLPVDGAHAVISHVPADEFSGGVIDSHIQDLNWVGARGLEHERVVAWFVDNADIVPVSLFTLFSSDAALRDDAAARSATLRSQIERLQNKREWDLKVSYDQRRLAANAGTVVESIRAIDEEIEAASEGRKYLLQKKRDDLLKRELSTAARRIAGSLLDDLSPFATSTASLAIPRADGLPVVLNAALLVPRENETALRDAAVEKIARLAEQGIDVQLTGPWAPYRFTDTHDEHTD